MKTLWSSADPVDFDGRFTRFTSMAIATEPHRAGGPPIYIGGNSPAALPHRAARGRLARVRGLGRRGLLPPFEITNFLPDRKCIEGKPRDVADELLEYRVAGVGLMVFDLTMLPEEALRTMEWIVEEVAPLLD